ncbi:MAG TPA: tetratricopeptide repeat protein [Bacteroidales bacterium]|nr:tetratricopeptide repeat protein [Bacteroidales bacterium]
MAKNVVNDPYVFSDKIIMGSLFFIWGVLIIFGIITLMQPQWLIELSKPGRTEEALVNINAGNAYLYNANKRSSMQDYQLALTNYQMALKIDPYNIEALANTGVTYLFMNRLDDAKATFEKCLVIDSNSRYHTYVYLGDVCERKGEIEKALEYYLLAAKTHPDPAYPLRKAGLFNVRLKNFDEAINHLRQSIELTKSFENLYRSTLTEARYKTIKNNDTVNLKAIDEELSKTDYTSELQRFDKEIFDQTLRTSKDLGYAYMYLGEAYFLKSEFADAVENYQLSMQYFPSLNEKFKNNLLFAVENANKQPPR